MVTNNDQPGLPNLPTPAPAPQPNNSTPVPPPIPDGPAPAAPQVNNTAMAAEDADIIEPIWVARVEEVLNGHIQNPRELAKQMNAIRAEYIAQRYGITLKQGSERG